MDNQYHENYKDKKILIIGGTGTIGNHLVRHLLQEKPQVIRIFSRDEYKQYEMQQRFERDADRLRFLIGDVRDERRVSRAMEDIDYVFHLAAMKHVPFCEYNPFEAVQTNVVGTQNVIHTAILNKVKKVLFTSTDKAISPTNTYGATKLTAERLISAAEYQKGPKNTVFSSVRFGNVMGSRGSVIPLFKKQIREDRKITVTDMKMTRFMMTPTQAITLMLKSNQLATGGEVFVLKMPTVRLSDLAEIMIEEVCKKFNIPEPVQLKEIGIRPGEKMYEELMTEDEMRDALETPELFVISSIFSNTRLTYQKADHHSIYRENNSKEKAPIDKETLKNWILSEKFI